MGNGVAKDNKPTGHQIARRRLLTGGLSTLALPAWAATDVVGLDAGEVHSPQPGNSLPGYFARPSKGRIFPLILVNADAGGLNEAIKDICRRLAKGGFMAVAPDYYARFSGRPDAHLIAPDAQYLADSDAAIRWAAANKGDINHLGATGFGSGGRMIWQFAAHHPKIRAAVVWYGRLTGDTSPFQPARAADYAEWLNCPVLGLYGARDPAIPVTEALATEDTAKAAHKLVEIVVYPGAPSGFVMEGQPEFRADAAADGWKRMLAWFKRQGVAAAAG